MEVRGEEMAETEEVAEAQDAVVKKVDTVEAEDKEEGRERKEGTKGMMETACLEVGTAGTEANCRGTQVVCRKCHPHNFPSLVEFPGRSNRRDQCCSKYKVYPRKVCVQTRQVWRPGGCCLAVAFHSSREGCPTLAATRHRES